MSEAWAEAGGSLERRLDAIVGTRGRELPGLAVVVVKGGELAYQGFFGPAWIDPAGGGADRPVDARTKFRIASISKTVVGIAAMALAERGLLDLDRDLSAYLGFPLRNPFYPGEPINAKMLMSHLSSIRDVESYNIPLGRLIREAFLPGGEYWAGGIHYAHPREGQDLAPGRYFCYSNFNYGLLATAMEAAAGERFDRIVRALVLEPLGLEASFNLLDFPDEAFAHIAPLYRKASPEGTWDYGGPWIPQVDDFRGQRPPAGCRLLPGTDPADLSRYRPGDNGTIFSPQGGLRISAPDLARVMLLLMRGGELDGRRILREESVEAMMTRRWRWDPARRNGELYNGTTREAGLALMRCTGSFDEFGGDRLLPEGGPLPWGHHGDAYGLLSGMLFDPPSGLGLVYLIGGSSVDPERHRGRHSTWAIWEEEIQAAILEEALGGSPGGPPHRPVAG